jgi:hypothetical protein
LLVSKLSEIPDDPEIPVLGTPAAIGPEVVTWLESERVRIRVLSFPVLVLWARQVHLWVSKLRDFSKVARQPMQVYVMRIIRCNKGQKCIEVQVSPRLRNFACPAKIFFRISSPSSISHVI